jgi:hypothetical protein
MVYLPIRSMAQIADSPMQFVPESSVQRTERQPQQLLRVN